MSELRTIADVEAMSQGHLQVHHNLGDSAAPLSKVRHFLFNPHGRPLFTGWNKSDLQAPELPPSLPYLTALFRSAVGDALYQYGHIRADTGSKEIGRNILKRLAAQGEGALMLSPSNRVGRGLLDLNRSREAAVELPFPSKVEEELLSIYDVCFRVIWELYNTLEPHLRSVIQPHTMASGDLNPPELRRLQGLRATVQCGEGSYTNLDAVQDLLDGWKSAYNQMCTRISRSGVDVINGMKNSPEAHEALRRIPDQGFSDWFQDFLEKAGVPFTLNKPFFFLPSHPSAQLALACERDGLPWIAFDVPRHLLRRRPLPDGLTEDALTFTPHPSRVAVVGGAVVEALNQVVL